MIKKAVLSTGIFILTFGLAGAEETTKMPPVPDAIQDGVVCLLPEIYHRNLNSTFWRMIELNGEKPPEKLEITLGFHNGTAAGYSGCNSYNAIFVNPRGSLFGMKHLEVTTRQCDEEVCPSFGDSTNWEEKYLEALKAATKVEKTDTEMTLSNADGKQVILFEALK